MKKEIIFISTLAITFAFAHARSAYALIPQLNTNRTQNIVITVTATPTPTPSPTSTLQIKPKTNLQLRVVLKKTNVLKEIERRLASYNKLLEKIAGITKLTAAQKQVLEAQIKIEIGKLEEMQTKINGETDTTALQEEKKTILESYKSFALYLPKIEIIAHANKIIDVANALAAKTGDADLQKKITDAKTKAEVAISIVLPLLPEQYPDYRVDLKEARDTLRDARVLLNSVYSQLKTASEN